MHTLSDKLNLRLELLNLKKDLHTLLDGFIFEPIDDETNDNIKNVLDLIRARHKGIEIDSKLVKDKIIISGSYKGSKFKVTLGKN